MWTPSVSPLALFGARFPGSIQLRIVQQRVGEDVFFEAGQTRDLKRGLRYFLVQPFTSGLHGPWLDRLNQHLM